MTKSKPQYLWGVLVCLCLFVAFASPACGPNSTKKPPTEQKNEPPVETSATHESTETGPEPSEPLVIPETSDGGREEFSLPDATPVEVPPEPRRESKPEQPPERPVPCPPGHIRTDGKCTDTRQTGDPTALIATVVGNETIDLEVGHQMLFTCNGLGGMLGFDIKNPRQPNPLGAVGNRCQHLTIVSPELVIYAHHGDSFDTVPGLFPVKIKGQNLIALPRVGTPDFNYEGVQMMGNLLVATAHHRGIEIYEVQPSTGKMTRLSHYQGTLKNSWQVAIDDNKHVIYVADGEGGLALLDAKDPKKLQPISTIALSGAAKDVVVSGDIVYVAAGGEGVHVIDVSVPKSPKAIGKIDVPYGAQGIALGLDHLYVADWFQLRVYNVQRPNQPTLVATDPIAGPMTRLMGIAADKDTVFVGDWGRTYIFEFHKHLTTGMLLPNHRRLDFGRVPAGRSVTKAIALRNEGGRTIQINKIHLPAGMTAHPTTLSIPPGKGDFFEITYAPKAGSTPTEIKGSLLLAANIPDVIGGEIPITANDSELNVGDPAPPWAIPDLTGRQITSRQLAGKVVVIVFFGTW